MKVEIKLLFIGSSSYQTLFMVIILLIIAYVRMEYKKKESISLSVMKAKGVMERWKNGLKARSLCLSEEPVESPLLQSGPTSKVSLSSWKWRVFHFFGFPMSFPCTQE